jgi:predicted O-methyltransferase YrrM
MVKQVLNNFDAVTQKFGTVKYMNERRASVLRDFIVEHHVTDVLEIGFFQGKSSSYIAAILEDLGRGRLVTMDKLSAKKHNPNISDILESLKLDHRVEAIFTQRSHTWGLGKLLREVPRPQFDLCYFDGGHTWDVTGFGFLLVDMLLRPGGWIIFDDLDWTINKSKQRSESLTDAYSGFSEDERNAPGVRMVFELLAPHLGYTDFFENKKFQWGFARKPMSGNQIRP